MARQITDRALRYRANEAIPSDAPRVCSFCGVVDGLEVAHIDGHEENDSPENLTWSCRSCNVLAGNTLRAYGLGRLTHQFNPSVGARGPEQYRSAVDSLLGRSQDMSLRGAIGMLQATPHARRAEYARQLRNPGAKNLREYLEAIGQHDGSRRPGRHDKGGLIIHQTPKWRRKEFQAQIDERFGGRHTQGGAGGGGVPEWVMNPGRKKTTKFDRCVRDVKARGGAMNAYAVCQKSVGRGNPADSAAEAFEGFHGFPPAEQVVIETSIHEHGFVWACGDLVYLLIVPLGQETPEGEPDECVKLHRFGGAFVTANEARNQLFLDGGDQSIDLADFDLDPGQAHESEVIGKAVQVGYYTNKTHLGSQGGQALYEHTFGEARDDFGGHVWLGKQARPFVRYDVVNELLYFDGGLYTIPDEGISG